MVKLEQGIDHAWKHILRSNLNKDNMNRIVLCIQESWNEVKLNNDGRVIIGESKSIQVNKATANNLYMSIIYKQEVLKPKDGQSMDNLKKSYKWLHRRRFLTIQLRKHVGNCYIGNYMQKSWMEVPRSSLKQSSLKRYGVE